MLAVAQESAERRLGAGNGLLHIPDGCGGNGVGVSTLQTGRIGGTFPPPGGGGGGLAELVQNPPVAFMIGLVVVVGFFLATRRRP